MPDDYILPTNVSKNLFPINDLHVGHNWDQINPFHWDVEFADIWTSYGQKEGAGFDAVLCNPPYIGETKDADRFDSNIRRLPRRRALYERKMDIYYSFIGLAIEVIKPGGIIGFITTSYWLEADSARPLRNYLASKASFRKIVYFNENVVFEEAPGQHSLIFTAKKHQENSIPESTYSVIDLPNDCGDIAITLKTKDAEPEASLSSVLKGNQIWNLRASSNQNRILQILAKDSMPLGSAFKISMGVQSAAATSATVNAKLKSLDGYLEDGDIFVVPDSLVKKWKLTSYEQSLVRPYVKNSEINQYTVKPKEEKFVLWIDTKTKIDHCPNLLNHLQRYRDVLESRSQVSAENWYCLRSSKRKLFGVEKGWLMCPYRATYPRFAFSPGIHLAGTDAYFIYGFSSPINLKHLVGILNSAIANYWLLFRGKRKGDMLELFQGPLSEIPLPRSYDHSLLKELELHVEKALESSAKGILPISLHEVINDVVFEIYHIPASLKREILSQHPLWQSG